MKFGIYDTLSKSWLLCRFDEEQYNTATEIAAERNDKYNGKAYKKYQPEYGQYKRYVVKAFEKEVAKV